MAWNRLLPSWLCSRSRRTALPGWAKRRRTARPSLEVLEDRRLLSSASLLKDINTDTLDANPQQMRSDGSRVFFVADDGLHGQQLWVSDGTADGTIRLTDNGLNSPFAAPSELTVVNHTLFFSYRDATHGRELWKTDGTVAGTVLVKDINAGSNDSSPLGLTAVGDTLFFAANDGVHGEELWKSDGTDAGTVLVKDINPGPGDGLIVGGLVQMVNANGTLFFVATTLQTGGELWKSDGTEAGTTLVAEINPGPGGGGISQLTAAGNGVFFRASPSQGLSLFYSDGTATGTQRLVTTFVDQLTDVGPTLYFVASSVATGYELWKSDGTVDGTVRVRPFNSAAFNVGPQQLAAVGDTLFFSATDGVTGFELWKSDGTEAGTVLVKDINPGPASSGPNMLTDVDGTLYFAAVSPDEVGSVLWKSDGTTEGTVKVKDVFTGNSSGTTSRVAAAAGGKLFFRGTDAATGSELWVSDGTDQGTALVKDINTITKDAYTTVSPSPNFADVNGTVYFGAFDRVNGRSLWKTDGTDAGTQLVKSFFPDADGMYVRELTAVGGTLFFRGGDFSLWKSDGTPDGTVPVAANPDRIRGAEHLLNVNGTLFFFAYDPIQGYGLYTSDGTDAGTVRVKGIDTTTSAANLTVLNGVLYFTTSNALWRSDGTAVGTQLVRSFFFPSPSNVHLIAYNGSLYLGFLTTVNTLHVEIWKSDGTAGGTALFQSVTGGGGGEPAEMTVSNGKLYYRVGTLWVTDGTTAGTRQLRTSTNALIGGSNLIDWEGALYFTTSLNGSDQLWKTDGTNAGTVLVAVIRANGGANVGPLTAYNGYLFFEGNDGVHGEELWRSDGTAAGTGLFQDINPGFSSSNPQNLTVEGGRLYFTADDGLHGREAWVLTLAPVVDRIVINDGSAQRSVVTSITVTFSETVSFDPSAFEVVTQDGESVGLNETVSEVGGRTVVVLTFNDHTETTGSLVDGRYTLTIHGDLVTDILGQQVDGDRDGQPGGDNVTQFFRLFGDARGTGYVDSTDLFLFRQAYGKRAGQQGYQAYFDYNGDGVVDDLDYAAFRERFGTHV